MLLCDATYQSLVNLGSQHSGEGADFRDAAIMAAMPEPRVKFAKTPPLSLETQALIRERLEVQCRCEDMRRRSQAVVFETEAIHFRWRQLADRIRDWAQGRGSLMLPYQLYYRAH